VSKNGNNRTDPRKPQQHTTLPLLGRVVDIGAMIAQQLDGVEVAFFSFGGED
jgi:hypothetical protein